MRFISVVALLSGVAGFASIAFAEGGYYSGLLGSRASGRAGAFTAAADDVTAVSYNPAGLAKIDGTLILIGNSFSYNASSFTRAPTADWGDQNDPGHVRTFTKVTNQKPWQALDPFLGVASNLGLSNWAFALAAYAPPGISNMEYPLDGGQRYMMVRRENQILNYAASIAWRLRDIFGLGVSLQWIHLRQLDYSLVIDGNQIAGAAFPVKSRFDILANISGSSLFTFNAVVGTWYRPVPFLELGLSGQVVPANIKADSHLSVQSLGELQDLTLYHGTRASDSVTLTLPLPMMARAGARYRHLENNREVFDVELDLEYVTWSRVNRFVLDTHGDMHVKAAGTDIPLGTINIDKQWRDTIAVKLGGDYAVLPDKLTLRGGAYYETAVAKPAYAHVDFPDGPKIGGTVGASLFFGAVQVALAYQLRYQPSIKVYESDARVYQTVPASTCVAPYTNTDLCNAHYLGQPAPAVNAGLFTATSHILAIDVLYRY